MDGERVSECAMPMPGGVEPRMSDPDDVLEPWGEKLG